MDGLVINGLAMNHRILSRLLLLSLLILHTPIASSAQSQWTEEGLLLSNEYAWNIFIEPDNEGGVWILYDNYVVSIDDVRPKLQHLDADGNKLLGPEGIFVCADTMIAGWSLGLNCLPDNGVAVAYSWFRFDLDPSTSEIYGQRISAAGERLLDSNGVQLTFTNTQMYKGNSNHSSVCGDGSDGMWVVCT